MIEAENLTKHYKRRAAVQDVSFSCEPGRTQKNLALVQGLLRQLQQDGVAPAGGTPEQFHAQIKKEIGIWRKVAADAGVKAE